jgi:PAS domain S-box-containing protein
MGKRIRFLPGLRPHRRSRANTPLQARLNPRLTLIAGTLGFAVIVLMMFGLGMTGVFLMARGQQIDSARLTASLVEDGLTRTLDSTKSLLLTVRNTIQHVRQHHPLDRNNQPDWTTIENITGQSLRFSPHIRQLVIADGTGRIILDTHGGSKGQRLNLAALGLDADKRAQLRASALFKGFMVGQETPGRFLPTLDQPPDVSARTIVPAALSAGPDLLVVAAINPASLKAILSHAHRGAVRRVCLADMAGTPLLGVGADEPCDRTALQALLEQAARSGADQTLQSIPSGRALTALSSKYPVAVVSVLSDFDSVAVWLGTNRVIVSWSFVAAIGMIAVGALLLRETLKRMNLENRLALVSVTEAVFAHSAEPMLIVDRDGLIQVANPAFLNATGFGADDVVAARAEAFLSPAQDAQQDPGPLPYWHLTCRDGKPRAVEYQEAPLTRDTVILTMNDITERIALQRALEAAVQRAELASQAKSEFLASMSHELLTPLNAILGFSEIIQEQILGPVSPPRYMEYLADIHDSGSHLRDIISDLLDLAKIEAGTFDLDPEIIDVNAEIRTCCRLVGKRAADHGLTLTIETAVDLPTLFTDRQVFRQLMFNLLSNAIKFTPTDGAILAGARQQRDGSLHVFVRDTGMGISPEDQARIFNAYERALNTQVRKIQGSGLGLSLVKSMIETQGGRVLLDSAPGRGSTFTLVFPAERVHPPKAAASAS